MTFEYKIIENYFPKTFIPELEKDYVLDFNLTTTLSIPSFKINSYLLRLLEMQSLQSSTYQSIYDSTKKGTSHTELDSNEDKVLNHWQTLVTYKIGSSGTETPIVNFENVFQEGDKFTQFSDNEYLLNTNPIHTEGIEGPYGFSLESLSDNNEVIITFYLLLHSRGASVEFGEDISALLSSSAKGFAISKFSKSINTYQKSVSVITDSSLTEYVDGSIVELTTTGTSQNTFYENSRGNSQSNEWVLEKRDISTGEWENPPPAFMMTNIPTNNWAAITWGTTDPYEFRLIHTVKGKDPIGGGENKDINTILIRINGFTPTSEETITPPTINSIVTSNTRETIISENPLTGVSSFKVLIEPEFEGGEWLYGTEDITPTTIEAWKIKLERNFVISCIIKEEGTTTILPGWGPHVYNFFSKEGVATSYEVYYKIETRPGDTHDWLI